ncbi:hypothetical protein [Terrabacter sp. NPDC080008]|uniref:hypothetical protein n=1 Tax=Terrabacter sp. NPDC080008 TaxID=3155176 RepID=UPI00344B2C2E
MERDPAIPHLTKDVSWPVQPPRKLAQPRKPVVWTGRDIAGGLAALLTGVAVLVASWPGVKHPWPVGLKYLGIALIGNAGGVLAVVVFAAVAGRPLLDPFGRAKPGWVQRIAFLHVVYFAGAAAFSFMAAPTASGWLWVCGLFWVAMTVWRVRAGWRAGHP